MRPTWIKDLPVLFKEVGLEDVKQDMGKASKRDSFQMHECTMLAFEMILGKGKDMAKLIDEAVRETRKGSMFEVERFTVVGRKALGTEA